MFKFLKEKITIGGIVILVILTVLPLISFRVLERNDSGKTLVMQYPTGEVSVYLAPGIKGQWFGKSTNYDKEGDYEFEKRIRFNDGGRATIVGSFRYKLPEDEVMMKKIHASYPTEEVLKRSLIGNVVDKAVYTTGPLMSSKESSSEKRNDLLVYIEDQAENGTFLTYTQPEKKIDPLSGKEVTIQVTRIRQDSSGVFSRAGDSPVEEFGIRLYKLTIDNINYDNAIEDQLQLQMKAELDVQTAIADAKKAEQRALQAEAEGRRQVAEVNATKAVELARAVADARKDSIAAAVEVATAELKARQKKIEADAKFYENQRLVSAGLTPQEKAQWEYKTAVGVAKELKDAKVPEIMISGGQGKDGASPNTVLLMQMLKEMQKKKK
ncbi:MAG: SPFH domain-containing protein [Bacteroidia bacterium]|nr:SPFH domain-containing protein [Bacteroidia bacterium]